MQSSTDVIVELSKAHRKLILAFVGEVSVVHTPVPHRKSITSRSADRSRDSWMRISLQDFLDCCFDAQISPAWPDWDSISTILRDTDQEGHSDGIERGEAGDGAG